MILIKFIGIAGSIFVISIFWHLVHKLKGFDINVTAISDCATDERTCIPFQLTFSVGILIQFFFTIYLILFLNLKFQLLLELLIALSAFSGVLSALLKVNIHPLGHEISTGILVLTIFLVSIVISLSIFQINPVVALIELLSAAITFIYLLAVFTKGKLFNAKQVFIFLAWLFFCNCLNTYLLLV